MPTFDEISTDFLTARRANLRLVPPRVTTGQLGTPAWHSAAYATDSLTGALSINVLRALPFQVTDGLHVDELAFRVTAAGGAGSVARVGIYESNEQLYPTSLLIDGGEQDGTVVELKSTSVDLRLSTGRLYWFAYLCGVAAPTIRRILSSLPVFGISDAGATRWGWTIAQAYGALPNPFPLGALLLENAAELPMVIVQVD